VHVKGVAQSVRCRQHPKSPAVNYDYSSVQIRSRFACKIQYRARNVLLFSQAFSGNDSRIDFSAASGQTGDGSSRKVRWKESRRKAVASDEGYISIALCEG
jgi:hypothetical protein